MGAWFKRLLDQDTFALVSSLYVFLIASSGLTFILIGLWIYFQKRKNGAVTLEHKAALALQKYVCSLGSKMKHFDDMKQKHQEDVQEYDDYMKEQDG